MLQLDKIEIGFNKYLKIYTGVLKLKDTETKAQVTMPVSEESCKKFLKDTSWSIRGLYPTLSFGYRPEELFISENKEPDNGTQDRNFSYVSGESESATEVESSAAPGIDEDMPF